MDEKKMAEIEARIRAEDEEKIRKEVEDEFNYMNRDFGWYKEHADAGDAQAQWNLGLCYDDGEGVSMDQEKAVYWYKKAADQGYIPAYSSLGQCYEYGSGVSKNLDEAIYWYKKAADVGVDFAIEKLNKLRK